MTLTITTLPVCYSLNQGQVTTQTDRDASDEDLSRCNHTNAGGTEDFDTYCSGKLKMQNDFLFKIND